MKLYEACEEVQEDFSALLDDELAPDEVEGVEAHLSTCSDCLRELDSLKKMQSVFQAMPRVSAPANFRVDVGETPKSAPVALRIDPRRARAKSYKPLFVAAAMLFFIATLWGLVQTTPRETASTDVTEASSADSVFNVALVESEASGTTADTSGLLATKPCPWYQNRPPPWTLLRN